MNKSIRGSLKLNSQLNGKITNHTPNKPVCDVNHFKKIKTNPFLFVEFKLINLHKYVHNHYKKE
jgi:hypothetical protein